MRNSKLETPLQRACKIKNVSGDFWLACAHLHSCGISLSYDLIELYERYQYRRDYSVRILDLCCGSGHAAETCVQTIYAEAYQDGISQINNIEMYGVDINPLPHLIPEEVRERSRWILEDFGIEGDQMAKLVEHDLNTGIPFPDNHFDYIYSVEGMIYIEDGLRLLEEIYRVLKPGAKAVIRVAPWFIAERDENGSKLFSNHRLRALREIMQNTPGAEDVFTIEEEKEFDQWEYRGGIIIRKPEEPTRFTGFTKYRVKRVMTGAEMFDQGLIDLTPLLEFVRSAVYELVEE